MTRKLAATLIILSLLTVFVTDVPINIEKADAGALKVTISTSRVGYWDCWGNYCGSYTFTRRIPDTSSNHYYTFHMGYYTAQGHDDDHDVTEEERFFVYRIDMDGECDGQVCGGNTA